MVVLFAYHDTHNLRTRGTQPDRLSCPCSCMMTRFNSIGTSTPTRLHTISPLQFSKDVSKLMRPDPPPMQSINHRCHKWDISTNINFRPCNIWLENICPGGLDVWVLFYALFVIFLSVGFCTCLSNPDLDCYYSCWLGGLACSVICLSYVMCCYLLRTWHKNDLQHEGPAQEFYNDMNEIQWHRSRIVGSMWAQTTTQRTMRGITQGVELGFGRKITWATAAGNVAIQSAIGKSEPLLPYGWPYPYPAKATRINEEIAFQFWWSSVSLCWKNFCDFRHTSPTCPVIMDQPSSSCSWCELRNLQRQRQLRRRCMIFWWSSGAKRYSQ